MKTSKEMQLKFIDKMRENIEGGNRLFFGLQYKQGNTGVWDDDVTSISGRRFELLDHRIKPKTITINGVEIPRPLSKEEVSALPWGTYVYLIASNDELFTPKERQFIERKDFSRVMCFSTMEEAVEASKALFGIKE